MAPFSAAPSTTTSRRQLRFFACFDNLGSRRQCGSADPPAGWAGGIRKKVPPQLRPFFAVAAALLSTFENVDDAGILPESN